jgi:hypothetical protein
VEKTIEYLKKRRQVPDDLKERVKEFNRNKKAILGVLKEGPKSIPAISEKTRIPGDLVTYILMTLRKYHEVTTDEIDDMDEYFFYKLSKQK